MKQELKEADFLIYELNAKLSFGKHQYKTVEEIAQLGNSYLSWCIINIHNFVLAADCLCYIKQNFKSHLSDLAIETNSTKLNEVFKKLKRISALISDDNYSYGEEYSSNIYLLSADNKYSEISIDYLVNENFLSYTIPSVKNANYSLSFIENKLILEEDESVKKVKFRIDIIEVEDFPLFAKYQRDLLSTNTFQIHKIISGTSLILYVTIDYSQLSIDDFHEAIEWDWFEPLMLPTKAAIVKEIMYAEIPDLDKYLFDYVEMRKILPSQNLYYIGTIYHDSSKEYSPSGAFRYLDFEMSMNKLDKYVSAWHHKFPDLYNSFYTLKGKRKKNYYSYLNSKNT